MIFKFKDSPSLREVAHPDGGWGWGRGVVKRGRRCVPGHELARSSKRSGLIVPWAPESPVAPCQPANRQRQASTSPRARAHAVSRARVHSNPYTCTRNS